MDQLPHKEGDWFYDPQTHKSYKFGYDYEIDAMAWAEIDLEAHQTPWPQRVELESKDLLRMAYIDSPQGWIPVPRDKARI